MMKLIALFMVVAPMALAATPESNTPAKKTRFVKGKDMSFDSQLVEGQIYRPDLSVVTGDTELGGTGILRIRKDFADKAVSENGEVRQ